MEGLREGERSGRPASLDARKWTAPDVGVSRDQGPGAAPCAYTHVGSLCRFRQFDYRQVRSLLMRGARCAHVQSVSEEAAPASLARQAHGDRAGQREIPPAGLHALLLRRYRNVLTLLFLSPISPQLAPIERVWRLARRLATHNRFFGALSELLTAVDSCFDLWQKPNAVLRRLCGIIQDALFRTELAHCRISSLLACLQALLIICMASFEPLRSGWFARASAL